MSTILRALKKLEHEKAARKPEQADLDLEFLNSPAPAPRRSLVKTAVVVSLLIAVGGAATYLYLTGSDKQPAPVQPPAPQPRQAVLKAATTVMPTAAPLANRSSASAPGAVPAPPIQAVQKPGPSPQAVTPVPPAAKVQADTPPKPAPVAKQHAPQPPKAPKPQLQTAPPLSLTVNGIALSDGEKRKAIVNGMSVSVGSTVGGARVEEILGNRVRFSYGGKSFEISVGNTGP